MHWKVTRLRYPQESLFAPLCSSSYSNSKGKDPGNKLTWKAKEPYWIYAEDYQIPTGDLHFVDDAWAQYKDKTVPQTKQADGPKKAQSVLASLRTLPELG